VGQWQWRHNAHLIAFLLLQCTACGMTAGGDRLVCPSPA
jgi:hypothetical protein